MIDEILLQQVRTKANAWLSDDYDAETRKEVQNLLDREDPADLIESFYRDL